MSYRWICGFVLVMLAPFTAAAQDKKAETAPTIVVRVRSLDAVVDNFKLLAAVVGKEDIGLQLEGIIKSKVGPKGLDGIDPARPFGAYLSVDGQLNDVVGAALVPISDEKQILGLLENLNINVKKGDDGVYAVTVADAVPLFFRFAHKYAYITALNAKALDKDKLIEPAKIFPAKGGAVLAASVRLDQVPEIAKGLALSNIKDKLDALKDRQPKENDAQHKFRLQAQQELAKAIENVIFNGRELHFELDVDAQTKEFALNMSVTGRPKSALADDIAKLAARNSLFGNVKLANPVIAGRLHVTAPEDLRKVVETILGEETKKALANLNDEAKRKQAEELLKLLADNFKTGEIDGAVYLNGPGKEKHFNLVAGIKLPDGEKLGKKVTALVADVLKDLPERERKKIELDADFVGPTKIHKIEIKDGMDAKTREMFGENPLYIAFRADGAYVAAGEDGLVALKRALGTPPAPGGPAQLEINVARLAPFLAQTPAQQAAIDKMFTGDDSGTIRVSVTGGASLRLQVSTKLSVLQFFTVIAAGKGKK
jgi:hypothetical protein